MLKPDAPEPAALKRAAIDALRALAMHDTRGEANDEVQPPVISAFVSRNREVMTQLLMPTAGLVIIIEGRKEILFGAERRVYEAGDAFVLPANARSDVVNEPDPRTGFYRALFIRFPRPLVIEAARLWPQYVGQETPRNKPVISDDLRSAILHAAEAISHRVAASKRVMEHRILEILLILAEQGVLSLAPKYVNGSVADAVRLLVRHRLHLPWSAAGVAAEFNMSEATLRRRLRAEDQTLQDILLDERMKAAYIVLNDRDADVADALAATGYRSRSHFARQFQERFGKTPSSVRRRKQPAS
ncbi:helix-turn-helix domain-containing protein [Rhizobium gallicum]|uniref:helix-turn-helix domain-containing protein n=1 Tax=Rhizobium gallicum TaxID=56730 RepID=UPI001EF8C629|nr:helix-turn-helix domain-containing protein [Rhizobium gallicum]ULJ73971.1 AraC family transcriptional regulator [Rhizobium gallicum]